MKRLKSLVIPVCVLSLIVVNVVVLNKLSNTSQALEEQQSITVETKSKLRSVKGNLSTVTQEKESVTSSLEQERSKSANLEKENTELKAKRAARLAAAQAVVSEPQVAQPSQPAVSAVAVTGSCAEWLAQAGVTDTASAMTLISRESGCNPNAVNNSSGACGVGQELPCGKSGCSLGDGACQVAWMKQYVEGRYGSFASALNHSYAVGWY